MGNSGWSFQDVLPYFRRTESRLLDESPENEEEIEQEYSQYRGAMGPMTLSDPAWSDPLCDAFIESVASHGVPKHNDYNARSQLGAGYYQRFIHGRTRVSAATAYLKSAVQRSNVELLTGVRVEKTLIEKRRAKAVQFHLAGADGKGHGETRLAFARREVILSAGTVNTTRLMQLSGIGNGSLLQSLDIPITHDLPGVGENFQDHYFVRCAARLQPGVLSLNQRAKGWRLAVQMGRWVLGLPSIMTLSPSVAYAFLNSESINGHPDLQFVFSPGSYKPGKVYELDNFPAVTCGFTQQRPQSVGYVRLRSSDANDTPLVQPNYLAVKLDQVTVVRGIRLCRQLLRTVPLNNAFAQEEVPGEELQSDDELLNYARNTGNTGYRLVGTCTMGPQSNSRAVVSPQLRVHGITGLRVVDASVMPRLPSSNTCAASLMIAEKGADMILRNE